MEIISWWLPFSLEWASPWSFLGFLIARCVLRRKKKKLPGLLKGYVWNWHKVTSIVFCWSNHPRGAGKYTLPVREGLWQGIWAIFNSLHQPFKLGDLKLVWLFRNSDVLLDVEQLTGGPWGRGGCDAALSLVPPHMDHLVHPKDVDCRQKKGMGRGGTLATWAVNVESHNPLSKPHLQQERAEIMYLLFFYFSIYKAIPNLLPL